MGERVSRVAATADAERLLERLRKVHGPLMFHQSGGCCDGSAPMCYPQNEFKVGARDVYLGTIAQCPFYISGRQFEVWQHTHLTVDVVRGRGSGFSVEAPEGVRFIIRSRVYTPEEAADLAAQGAPARGAQPVEA
jgi:hypothetical protein